MVKVQWTICFLLAMPIAKFPVRHKFGIVSLSKAQQILAESYAAKLRDVPRVRCSSPTEIDQPFISRYNSADEKEREKLDSVVRRALLHARYKAGLHGPEAMDDARSSKTHDPTTLDHSSADVPCAWLELMLLSQCCGPHQQDVLINLATSMLHAPLSLTHIPSLLYIAGLCYQWLKSDEVLGKILRSGEVLLLKILYLVSLRIFYHHLVGSLKDICTREEVRQLKFDIEGFENRERTYRNFPEALLHWKVALEIGQLVCENYSKPLHDPSIVAGENGSPTEFSSERDKQTSGGTHSGYKLTSILWHALDLWQCVKLGSPNLKEAVADMLKCTNGFDSENWIEGMLAIDILCSASQRNLNVLHLVMTLADGFRVRPSSVKEPVTPSWYHQGQHHDWSSPSSTSQSTGPKWDLEKLPEYDTIVQKKGTRFVLPSLQEESVHSGSNKILPPSRDVTTLNILGMQPDFSEPDALFGASDHDASTPRSEIAGSLRSSSVGTQGLIETGTIPDTVSSRFSNSSLDISVGSNKKFSNVSIASKTQQQALGITARAGPGDKVISLEDVVSLMETRLSLGESTPIEERLERLDSPLREAGSWMDLATPGRETHCTHYTHSSVALSGGGRILGSQVPPSTLHRHSVCSLPSTDDLELDIPDNFSKLETWPSEVAVAYALNFASVVIYGWSSAIQQIALEGNSSRSGKDEKHRFGLLQLSEFTHDENSETKPDFSSWSIRHCAVLGLSRVCRACKDLPMKDGMNGVAWSRLMQRHSVERDSRVLEAYKMLQACPDLDEQILRVTDKPSSAPFIDHMANSLAQAFLPPHSSPGVGLKPATAKKSTGRSPPKPVATDDNKSVPFNSPHPKVDTGLLTQSPPDPGPPSYLHRTSRALHRIAEEHWRRQVQQEQEKEEEEEQRESEKKRQEHDMKMKRKAEKLARRLKSTVAQL